MPLHDSQTSSPPTGCDASGLSANWLDDFERGFGEPWQAEAFATAVHLSSRGLFTWSEWVEVFSAEIAASPQRPDESVEDAYYRQWLTALETILRDRDILSAAEVDAAQEDWRRSYLNTAHGQPVAFRRDLPPGPAGAGEGHDHGHHHDDRHGHGDDHAHGHHDHHHGHHHHDHPHGGTAKPKPVHVSPAH